MRRGDGATAAVYSEIELVTDFNTVPAASLEATWDASASTLYVYGYSSKGGYKGIRAIPIESSEWGGNGNTINTITLYRTDGSPSTEKVGTDVTITQKSAPWISGINAVGSSSIPTYITTDGEISACTDDFVHDGDVTSTYSATGTAPVNGTAVASAISGKADKVSVTAATKCKITYNSQGIVTAGADLAATDIPSLDATKITSGTFGTSRIADDAITAAKVKDNETLPVYISGYGLQSLSWEVENNILYHQRSNNNNNPAFGWSKIVRIERTGSTSYNSVKVRGYFYNENGNHKQNYTTRLHFEMVANFHVNAFRIMVDGIPDASTMIRAVKVSDTVVELHANYASTYTIYHVYYSVEQYNASYNSVTHYSTQTAVTESSPLFVVDYDNLWNAYAYYSNCLLGTELTSSNDLNNYKVALPGGKLHYYWYSATKPSNTPTGSNSCVMECDGGVSSNQTTQILHPMGNEKNTVYYWIRSYDGTSWSDWKTIYYEATSTYSSTGTQAVNGTAVASAIAATDFSHISQNKLWHSIVIANSSSSDGWFKLATINKKGGDYESYRIIGYYYFDVGGNFNSSPVSRYPFQAIVNFSANTYRFLEGKTWSGNGRVRLAKIDDTKYEVQYRLTPNDSVALHAVHDKTNGSTNDVVFETTKVAASTPASVAGIEEDMYLGSIAYRSVGDRNGNDITTTYMKTADAMTVAGGNGIDVTYSGSTVTFAANITSIPRATINALV